MWATVVAACACSPSAQIASSSVVITERIGQIRSEANEIVLTTNQDSVRKNAGNILRASSDISKEVSDIQVSVSGVEDKTPWWANMLVWISICGSFFALVWVLHATGISSAVRSLLGLIPRKIKSDSSMLHAVLDSNDPVSIREYIAMRRADSKDFDSAWKMQSKEKDVKQP